MIIIECNNNFNKNYIELNYLIINIIKSFNNTNNKIIIDININNNNVI